MFTIVCFGEPRQAAAHDNVGAGQIDVEHEFPVRNPYVEHRAMNHDAGGIYDAINTAHGGCALFDGTRD